MGTATMSLFWNGPTRWHHDIGGWRLTFCLRAHISVIDCRGGGGFIRAVSFLVCAFFCCAKNGGGGGGGVPSRLSEYASWCVQVYVRVCLLRRECSWIRVWGGGSTNWIGGPGRGGGGGAL